MLCPKPKYDNIHVYTFLISTLKGCIHCSDYTAYMQASGALEQMKYKLVALNDSDGRFTRKENYSIQYNQRLVI